MSPLSPSKLIKYLVSKLVMLRKEVPGLEQQLCNVYLLSVKELYTGLITP